jgi:hypothetical protein
MSVGDFKSDHDVHVLSPQSLADDYQNHCMTVESGTGLFSHFLQTTPHRTPPHHCGLDRMVSSFIPGNKVAIVIGSLSFLSILYVYRKTRSWAALPPDLPASPVVGNVFQMPKEQPWLKYAELAKRYGESCSGRGGDLDID